MQIYTYSHIHIINMKNQQFELLVWGSHSHQLYHHAFIFGSPPTDGEQCKGFQLENCVWGHHIHNSMWTSTLGEVLQCYFSEGALLWGMSREKCQQFAHYFSIELTSGSEVSFSIQWALHTCICFLKVFFRRRVKPSLEKFDSLV